MRAVLDSRASPTDARITIHWVGPGNIGQAADLMDRWLVSASPQDDLDLCLTSVDTAAFVAKEQGQVVGLVIYQLHRTFSEVVLKHLVVAPWSRRKGVGKRLVSAVKGKLLQGYDRISMVLPETNTAGHLLLRSAGFKAVQILRGYFGDEAGYVMECPAELVPAAEHLEFNPKKDGSLDF